MLQTSFLIHMVNPSKTVRVMVYPAKLWHISHTAYVVVPVLVTISTQHTTQLCVLTTSCAIRHANPLLTRAATQVTHRVDKFLFRPLFTFLIIIISTVLNQRHFWAI